jgi:ribonuclease III
MKKGIMYRNKKDHQKITRVLGYEFKNEKLLLQALTRRSGLNEGRQKSHIGDFQRLEFIGDKVLNLVVSDVLLENHPTWSEGELTKKASEFVNNKGPLAQGSLIKK